MPIPESFGDLKNLSYLQLAHNQLTGRIPDSLSTVSLKNPSAYAIYDLSYNLLSGPIPSELEKIRYATFYLEGNNDLCMPDDEYFQQWLKKHVAFKLADTLRICPTPKGRTTPKGRIYQAE